MSFGDTSGIKQFVVKIDKQGLNSVGGSSAEIMILGFYRGSSSGEFGEELVADYSRRSCT